MSDLIYHCGILPSFLFPFLKFQHCIQNAHNCFSISLTVSLSASAYFSPSILVHEVHIGLREAYVQPRRGSTSY